MGKRKGEQQRDRHSRKRRKMAAERQQQEAEQQKEQESATLEIPHGDFIPLDDDAARTAAPQQDTREYFGMLTEEEQSQFRDFDEQLSLDDDERTPEERAQFLANVFEAARGKELKLASSQSSSRLMERMIMLSNTRQKKHLFDAFANHFPTLVTHRFGSHCCEQLFLRSAPIVTHELTGEVEEEKVEQEEEEQGEGEAAAGEEKQPLLSMEELFLLVLDELEENLTVLMTDTFGSHALRVLLTILSGRPLDEVSTKSLLRSKKKEKISLPSTWGAPEEANLQLRTVPASFDLAVRKIISDVQAGLDATMLAVVVKHPTGNPIMQLLLELDIALNTKAHKGKKSATDKDEEPEAKDSAPHQTLLERLLPDAPASLKDENSDASRFVSGLIYDPIGSRLLETLLTHCPGKIFKGLYTNILGPRLDTLLRNETATFVLMKALVRLSKEDLADAVQKTIPKVELLLSKGRYNVLTLLFERCQAREAAKSTEDLLKAVTDACTAVGSSLVRRLCYLDDNADEDKKASKKKSPKSQEDEPLADPPKKKDDLIRNGTKLATTLIQVGGAPTKAVQGSLLFLKPEKLVQLATCSAATAKFLTAAIGSPSSNPVFHKLLVTSLMPHVLELAHDRHGHHVLNALVRVPSKAEGFALPFFLKQSMVEKLTAAQSELYDSEYGMKTWKEWKGELWAHRRPDWIRWAKEVEPEEARWARAPKPREAKESKGGRREVKGDGFERRPARGERKERM